MKSYEGYTKSDIKYLSKNRKEKCSLIYEKKVHCGTANGA
jgi:hypothetical protein